MSKVQLTDWKVTALRHHTDRFPVHNEWRVARRGETVSLTVSGEGQVLVKSAALVRVYDDLREDLSVLSGEGESRIEVQLPAKLPLGLYHVAVGVACSKSDGAEAAATESCVEDLSLPQDLLIVANPWNEDDDVYMSVAMEREEYVLASQGRVYAGSKRGVPWSFGLYRDSSVRAVIGLLAKCTEEDRKSIPRLSRRLTSLLNSSDNNGVLQGNWSGDYTGGTKPWVWQGSAAILEEYVNSGEQPVKFGQCWVFSGLYTAVMRILGVPCRSVTNFASAHDTDFNRSIDKYFNEDGDSLEHMNADSIWNFHVWNDCWMKRPDLPAGYGGWQALDATPQEESKAAGERRSIYRMGPAPLHAIKEGLRCDYDTDFVIAEVNADVREWVVKANGDLELSSLKRQGVGTALVTKRVGNSRAQDVTDQYKYGEGTVEEVATLMSALNNTDDNKVKFEIVKPSWEDLPVGAKVRIGVKMVNQTDDSQEVSLRIRARLCTYTGRTLKALCPLSESVKLESEGEHEVETVVTPAEYLNEFSDRVVLVFHVFAQIGDDDPKAVQSFSATHSLFLEPPEIQLQVTAEVGFGDVTSVRFAMLNPLESNLTNVEVHAECDGLLREPLEMELGTLGGRDTLSGSFVVRGLELGTHELMVALTSDQLTGITSSVAVSVVDGLPNQPVLTKADELDIIDIDLKVPANRLSHHTEDYEDDQMLILRRGQPASMEIELSQDVKKVDVSVKLTLKKRTAGRRHTITYKMNDVPVHDKKLSLSVPLAADMPVGRYSQTVTVTSPSQHVAVFHSRDYMVVLFNPWCKEDDVYMESEEELEEYVLNEHGGIWVGSAYRNRPMKWEFGQFDMSSLETALFLIEKIPGKRRHQVVEVARSLTSAMNSADNNGVLQGNWSGDYSGGTPPTDWIGSVQIFEEYMSSSTSTRKKPVKYGQCFIFSGILTSALRTLGIPVRSVTNFSSGHDTHFNRAIDKYTNASGYRVADKNTDSVWNFHVWNEAWMKRSDLAYSFGGWQVVDTTPQERSGGVYQCGPAPLRAIKTGQAVKYDCNFVIGEVNGDVRHWTATGDGKYVLTKVQTAHVGKQISTKALGSLRRMDITHLYKFEEGSVEERAALGSNLSVGSVEGRNVKAKESDVVFDVDTPDVRFGDDVNIDVRMKNSSDQECKFEYRITATSLLYTGYIQGKPFHDSGMIEVTVPGRDVVSVPLSLPAAQYLQHLKAHQQPWLEIGLFGRAMVTGLCDVETLTLELTVPELQVELQSGSGEVRLGEPVKVKVSGDLSLSSPSPAIRGAVLSWHGRGLAKNQKQALEPIDRSVPFTSTITITPTLRGKRTLLVGLASSELVNVDGSLEVYVI